jgi:hypothetical protein
MIITLIGLRPGLFGCAGFFSSVSAALLDQLMVIGLMIGLVVNASPLHPVLDLPQAGRLDG